MKRYSKNQLQRYPIYLKYLRQLKEQGYTSVSSPLIANELGYSEEQIRKDLQLVSNEAGRPKKGRNIDKLIETLENFLGYCSQANALLIGAGHLGNALMNFPSFEEMGITILAGFDSDPNKIGTVINGKSILDMKELPRYIKEYKAHIVILTVPANVAQKITDYAVESGARAIWNFAPIHINVPGDVVIEDVNMASSLAVLWHRYLNLKNID